MERSNMICCLVGWYCGRNPSIHGADLKIKIDNHLIAHNLQPLTKEDTQLLEDLLAEQMIFVMSAGFNREMRRKV